MLPRSSLLASDNRFIPPVSPLTIRRRQNRLQDVQHSRPLMIIPGANLERFPSNWDALENINDVSIFHLFQSTSFRNGERYQDGSASSGKTQYFSADGSELDATSVVTTHYSEILNPTPIGSPFFIDSARRRRERRRSFTCRDAAAGRTEWDFTTGLDGSEVQIFRDHHHYGGVAVSSDGSVGIENEPPSEPSSVSAGNNNHHDALLFTRTSLESSPAATWDSPIVMTNYQIRLQQNPNSYNANNSIEEATTTAFGSTLVDSNISQTLRVINSLTIPYDDFDKKKQHNQVSSKIGQGLIVEFFRSIKIKLAKKKHSKFFPHN